MDTFPHTFQFYKREMSSEQSGGLVHSNVPPEISLDISLWKTRNLAQFCKISVATKNTIFSISKLSLKTKGWLFLPLSQEQEEQQNLSVGGVL